MTLPTENRIRTPFIYEAVLGAALHRSLPSGRIRHLDIGAGRGELVKKLGETMPRVESYACDFHVERFTAHVECKKVQLDTEPLPYPERSFDLVTCSEVVEHLENYRRLAREAFRVTAKGGVAVFTTPNVLNASSRLRYVVCGFAKLFGPLPIRNERLYSTGGHITPVPFYYLAQALTDAGYEELRFSVDKQQRTSLLALLVLAPAILFGWPIFWCLERYRYKTLRSANQGFVKAHASLRMLLGRTLVVSAVRSATSS